MPRSNPIFSQKSPISNPFSRCALWLALAVLLGMAGLLIIKWPHDSLWYDEALTTYVATHSWDTLWKWCTQVDIQVPFHYVVLRGWVVFAGDSEFALRALSVLSTLLAVAGVIGAGRRLVRRGNLGQVMGILFGFMPGMLWLAYEVRAYALALALYAWTTVFLLAILDAVRLRRSARWRIAGYVLLMAAALYTHYTALAAFVAHLIIFGLAALNVLLRRQGWRRFGTLCAAPALAGLLFAPWLPVMLARGTTDRSFYTGSLTPGFALEVLAGFKTLGRQDAPQVAVPLVVGYGVLIGIGLLIGLFAARARRAALYGAILAAVPVALTVALLINNPKLTGRYFWSAWLGLDALAALAIVLVTRWRVALAVPITLALVAVPWGTGERGTSPFSDYRGAFATICTQGRPDDVILLRDGTLFVTALYYGERPPCDTPREVFGMPYALITDVTRALSLGDTQGIMAQIAQRRPPNVWVIAWQGDIMDPQALTYALLDGIGQHTTQMYGDVRLDRFAQVDYATLAKLTVEGPLPSATWYNLTPAPNGPTLLALRLFAPPVAHAGDVIVLQAWWKRGATLQPDLRASGRITTPDNGWTYMQVDQPPSSWKYYDDRWPPDIPVLGRYELVVGPDVPEGKVAVRYVLYDALKRFDPVVITVGEIEVKSGR